MPQRRPDDVWPSAATATAADRREADMGIRLRLASTSVEVERRSHVRRPSTSRSACSKPHDVSGSWRQSGERAVQGQFTQPVEVRPQEVSVHLSSNPGGGKGDRAVEALGRQARSGGPASVRAVTRVKPEQASKSLMRAPSPLSMDEGRCGRPDAPTHEGRSARRGRGHSTYARADWQHGRPVGQAGRLANGPAAGRARQASEGLVVPLKPSNAGRGKGPWFGVRSNEPRRGRLAWAW